MRKHTNMKPTTNPREAIKIALFNIAIPISADKNIPSTVTATEKL
ncbi:hypothetical protein TOC8172_42370 [Pseudomonas syringae]